MIEAKGLHKVYGSTVAVNDLSFTLPEGQVTGFLGPNGSGKSTAMRLMLGLDYGPGETLYYGKRITELDSVTRMVGAHLDAKYFHPKRTARNHLRMLGQEAHVPNERVDEVIELLGLQSVADKAPKGFSLGMGQRLGLAGAILAEPKMLMLDEPANGLDPQSIHWLRDFIKLYADQGNVVFVSSHLLSEMELMADRLVVIAKGELVYEGELSDFVAQSIRNDVLVRTEAAQVTSLHDALKSSLELQDGQLVLEGSDGVSVSGVSTEQVGRIAHEAGVLVLELTARQASLEQAFLELTQDKQGYQTGKRAVGGTA